MSLSFTGTFPSSSAIPKAVKPTSTRFTTNATAVAVAVPVEEGGLYDVLGVKKTASTAEIKAAYRALAKRFHPDVANGVGSEFIEIQKAYSMLSDPTERQKYDRSRFVGRGVGLEAGRCRRWETDQCW